MKEIVILGSSIKDKGGIATVINNIVNSDLQRKFKIIAIPTYISKNKLKSNIMFVVSLLKVLYFLSIKKIKLYHIHVSMKGSFYRKVLLVNIIKLFNGKVIMHMHGSSSKDFYSNEKFIFKKIRNNFFEKADKVIVLSNSWKEFFSNYIDEDKIIVLNNCVEVPNYNKRDVMGTINFLFLGRFGERKGVYDLLDVIRNIKSSGIKKNFHLILGGDGEIDKVNKLIEEYGIKDVVSNYGWISCDMKIKVLEKSHVFILPSYNEGLPMAILEAMSYSMPIISTNIGGIPECVKNNYNGFLIEPGDKKNLQKSISYFIHNQDEIVNFGRNSYDTVLKEFNQKKIFDSLSSLYEILLGDI